MSPDWPVRAAPQPLRAGDVHVWALDRDAGTGDERLLSPSERARRDALRFPRDQRRYGAAHVGLRRLLAAYLECAPEEVRFILGPAGKPALDPETHAGPVRFNVSARGSLALLAVTRVADIGVDLEELVPFPDLREVAAVHFSPEEQAAIAAANGAEQLAAFYRCWTRKEAYLKALGVGLQRPTHGFAVSVDPRLPATLLHVGGDAREAEAWALLHLEPKPGFVGAVACRARGVEVRTFAATTAASGVSERR